MRKPSRIVLVAAGVAVLAGVAWACLRPREPLYNGKPCRVWVEQLYLNKGSSRSFGPWNEAFTNLIQIGTNALPCLLELAGTRDSSLKRAIRKSSLASKLPNVLGLGKRYNRWANASDDNPQMAVQGFYIVAGVEGKPPLPALIHLLRRSDNPSSRVAAARALEYFGTNAQETLPALVEAFSDPDKAVREAADEALAVISFAADPWELPGTDLLAVRAEYDRYVKRSATLIVPAITKLLMEHPEADARMAIQTLGSLGVEAKAALPAICKRLTSPDASIREAATNAVARIGIETDTTGSQKP